MSKRKHKHKPQPPKGPAATKEKGLKAFRQGDFDTAIAQWGRLDLETVPLARSVLAEAYFRRALLARETLPRLTDLRRALELLPNESRYWYHLGLTQHRADLLDDACAAYARAAELGFNRDGFGFVRGLAELERDPRLALGRDVAPESRDVGAPGGDVPPERLDWLSPENRAALFPIAALMRGEPGPVLASNSGGWWERLVGGDPAQRLWRGLALLSAGQFAEAAKTLTLSSGQRLPASAEAARAFYHGLALAASGDYPTAVTEWTAVAGPNSPPRLQAELANARLGPIRSSLDAGEWGTALEHAQAALKLVPNQLPLLAATLIARNRLANDAAQKGAWGTAAGHWEEMRAVLVNAPDLGRVAPILHNLAVAYERSEQWESAAQAWIALMNTLPKRAPKSKSAKSAKSADSSASAKSAQSADSSAPAKSAQSADSLSLAERRSWLRRHALDCFKKAGRPEQAITYYRQAVKASPDDLSLRLDLADALLANEQVVAARNELQRILDKDPGQLEAHVRLAEIHESRNDWDAAEQQLREALKADPQHDPARRRLAQLLRNRGHKEFNAGLIARSRDLYEKALQLAPDDADLLVSLGYAELVGRNETAARAHFETAMAKGGVLAYVGVFERWAYQKKIKDAQEIVRRAEAAGLASAHFYIDAAGFCFKVAEPPEMESPFDGIFGPPRRKKTGKKKPKADPWQTLAHELLQKAEAAGGDRPELLKHVLSLLGPTQPVLGLEYAEKLAGLTPEDPVAIMMLALFQALNDQTPVAKDTLRRAAHLARKQGNQQLLHEIEEMRRQISSPLFSVMARMAPLFGPLDEFEDDFDDDFLDEDLFR